MAGWCLVSSAMKRFSSKAEGAIDYYLPRGASLVTLILLAVALRLQLLGRMVDGEVFIGP